MKDTLYITYETTEMLDAWLAHHCPDLAKDKTFVRGILFIIDEGLRQAIRDERQRFFASIGQQAGSIQ